MRWEERLLDLFDDLEQQAAGLALSERDALVAEQSRAEYATLDLAARLHASAGSRLQVDVTGLGTLDASLARVGDGWCLLDAAGRTWVVPLRAVTAFRGLASGGVAAPARSVASRLGLGSALREMAEDRADVVLHRLDGQLVRGVLGRVGRDFVEVGRPGARRRRAVHGDRRAAGRSSALAVGVAAVLLGVGLGVQAGDVLLELDGLDAVLLAAADLDVAQLAGLDERAHLGHRGREDLRDVGERQEPGTGSATLRAGHETTMPAFADVSGTRWPFACG